jgi:predicted AlkP superfamily phosphohydrolase/phosphomutase
MSESKQLGKKAVVLGLDGATFDVLNPRVADGQMPNLAALLEEGVWGPLQSTVPPFSAQAWVSMATGKNQARHGVVDFWERSPDQTPDQHDRFVTADSVQAETLWQIVGRQGLQVGIVNVPVTYPPAPLNGYLVSGFLTPQGRDDFAFPPTLKAEIEGLVPGYNPDPFDPLGAGRQQILDIERWMEKHEQVSRHLAERYPSDLFFSVIQALDHVQHLFWDTAVSRADEGDVAPVVNRCYDVADEAIGHRRQMIDGETNLFLVSDHGFGRANKWFHVNRFLQERGYLVLDRSQSAGLRPMLAQLGLTPQRFRALVRRLDVLGLRRGVGRLGRVTLGRRLDRALLPPIDWARTTAISGSPATEGIYVNLKGREPKGSVEPGADYEAVRERLMQDLASFCNPETGEPVVRAVYRREDLYEGPFLDLLPDIVFDLGESPYLASDALPSLLSARGKAGQSQILEPLPEGLLQGRHQPMGIFLAFGPDIRRQGERPIEGARIIDVAPTILYSMGLPIPEDMDGRPLIEIFDADFVAKHPIRHSPAQASSPAGSGSQVDQEDTSEMERRLRGLGYIS